MCLVSKQVEKERISIITYRPSKDMVLGYVPPSFSIQGIETLLGCYLIEELPPVFGFQPKALWFDILRKYCLERT